MHLTAIIKELFWRLSWLLGLFHLAKHAQRRRLRILCYHGFELHDESRFKPGLFMSTATFKKRLQLIHRYGFTVLPLDEALQRLRARSLPPHSVTITIDDGFHSVSRVGAALLHAYHYPATIYVTTYYVQHQRPVFRLLIQYMFWKTAQRHIVLPECTWNRDTVVDLNDPSARHRLMWACIDHGERRCSEEGREQLAREFAGLLGIDYEQLAASRMFALMTPAEIRSLSALGFDLQLHTHHHRFPANDWAGAVREITQNRAILGAMVGQPTLHFCYPSGRWAEHQWGWLAAQGLRSATTCTPGFNDESVPRFALRRYLDREDVPEWEFLAELFGYKDLLRRVLRRAPAGARPDLRPRSHTAPLDP